MRGIGNQPVEAKRPKYDTIRLKKSVVDGLEHYGHGDKVKMVVEGKITGIRDMEDMNTDGSKKKTGDVEYEIMPDKCAVHHEGEHKKMQEMGVDKERYGKMKKAGMAM